MSEQLTKYEAGHPLEVITIEKDTLEKLQSFQKMYLHKPQNSKETKVNKFANDSEYLPISFLEMSLDEIFFGLWQTKNFQSQPIANEIVGSLELWYFHPVAKTWLCRIGSAAVQVQMKSPDNGGDGDITNIRNKITNTLTKDYPHLKADCFRNACLSLGKAFGRDLNRKFEDQYNPIIAKTEVSSIETKTQELINLIDKLPEIGLQNMYKDDLKKARKENKFNMDFIVKTIAKVQNDIP